MRRQAAMKSFVISFGNIAIFTLFCFWKKSEKLKKVEESLSKISKSNPFYIKITFRPIQVFKKRSGLCPWVNTKNHDKYREYRNRNHGALWFETSSEILLWGLKWPQKIPRVSKNICCSFHFT